MITLEIKPLAEITREAMRVLYAQIGIADTQRFISQFTNGYGDYTEERKKLYADVTLEELVAEIKQMRQSASADTP